MYIRSKRIKGQTYFYLVESERHGKRVIQKYIGYLGKAGNAKLASLAEDAGKYGSAEEFANRKYLLDFDVEEPVRKAVEVIPETTSSGFHGAFSKGFNGIDQSWAIVLNRKPNELERIAAEKAGLKLNIRQPVKRNPDYFGSPSFRLILVVGGGQSDRGHVGESGGSWSCHRRVEVACASHC